MAKVALEDEGKVERNHGDRRHSNEHRLQVLSADIRNVGYVLTCSTSLAIERRSVEWYYIPSVMVG